MAGTLFIVATPIGNLKDITFRAIDILKSVDYILCEDTRITAKILNSYNIDKKLAVLNDFNEETRVSTITQDLINGNFIALVSDAGTPLVSDPGFKLVRDAITAGVRVESVPGPSAIIAALSVAGLPTDKFLFLGFLPKKDGKRLDLLKQAKDAVSKIKSTIIIYEAPYRVEKTLKQLLDIFGDTEIVVCRELTKLHEEVYRGKISDFNMILKGEFIILL